MGADERRVPLAVLDAVFTANIAVRVNVAANRRHIFAAYCASNQQVIEKARYWERMSGVALNERQRFVITRLLEGFEGKLTTSKWATLTRSSRDTVLRDIQQLVERGVLVLGTARGRSTNYTLAGLADGR